MKVCTLNYHGSLPPKHQFYLLHLFISIEDITVSTSKYTPTNDSKRIICFGEALVDLLHFDNKHDGPLTLPAYRQFPGGAPANAAVAVARLGGDAHFIGQLGADGFGDFLSQSLNSYNVNTDLLFRTNKAKTALAFVHLDATGDRSFSFYRDDTADLLFDENSICSSWFENQPIVHFCSNTLTHTAITKCTKTLIATAKAQNSIISFDVNLRHNLWSTGQADIGKVSEFVYQADIVKFSRDEFDYLACDKGQDYINNCFKNNCKLLVITDGGNELEYITPNTNGFISIPHLKVVDTTAGGDAFIGALLHCLAKSESLDLENIDTVKLKTILTFAIACGGYAVTKQGAFSALPDMDSALNTAENLNFDIEAITKITTCGATDVVL